MKNFKIVESYEGVTRVRKKSERERTDMIGQKCEKECPPTMQESNVETGMAPCRKCGEMFFQPKGLYYGDPTICDKCSGTGSKWNSTRED